MRPCDLEVITFNRDGRKYHFDVTLPGASPARIGKLDTYKKLCRRYSSNRDVVFVAN